MSEVIKAMVAVMGDISHVGKEQNNTSQGFKYRGIDDIYNALHGLMAKHGLISVPVVLEKERTERTTKNGGILAFTCLRIKYTFYATDGSSIDCVVEGEGMDSGDKSSNKAMAVGHKYALLQAFCIPTDEVKDPDAESHEIVEELFTAEQRVTFDSLLENGEAYEFWLFWNPLETTVKTALFSAFPKGTITKNKDSVRKMEAQGLEVFNNLKESMIEHINNSDLAGLTEIGEELGSGKAMAFHQLTPEMQHRAQEMKK